MSALLLGLLIATQPVSTSPTTSSPSPASPASPSIEAPMPAVAPTPPPELPTTATPPATTTATEAPTDEEITAPATTAATAVPTPSMRGPVGVGLLAVGASLAAGGTVAFTFIEAVSAPDRQSNPPSASVERFTTISGFLGVAVASVSAVLVVIGAGLTLSESGNGDVPTT